MKIVLYLRIVHHRVYNRHFELARENPRIYSGYLLGVDLVTQIAAARARRRRRLGGHSVTAGHPAAQMCNTIVIVCIIHVSILELSSRAQRNHHTVALFCLVKMYGSGA